MDGIAWRSGSWIIFMAILVGMVTPLQGATTGQMAAADELMQGSQWGLVQAQEALGIYTELLPRATGDRYPLLVRLARTAFLVGDMRSDRQRRQCFEAGRGYAEALLQENPGRVEGHYWLAMNLAGLADTGSKREGLQILPQLLTELERALVLEPGYDQAGAARVLGRIYFEAPGWPLSVGHLGKSRSYLQMAVRLAPDNVTNHLYLAETLLRLEETAEAKQELELALRATQHAMWPGGLAEDQKNARRLLAELGPGL